MMDVSKTNNSNTMNTKPKESTEERFDNTNDHEKLARTDPSSHAETLAMQLLCSSDSKIAAAAKRIFSNTPVSSEDSSIQVSTGENANKTKTIPVPSVPEDISAKNCVTVCNRPQASDNLLETNTTKDESSDASTSNLTMVVPPVSTTMKIASVTSVLNNSMEDSPSPHSSACKPTRMKDGNKCSSSERLQRSRERNRMHARRTRQRKKEHLQNLQSRANELKEEQLRLKQIINEKNTANILLDMCSALENNVEDSNNSNIVDPAVEALLKRSADDIPSSSKIPELPALVLPSQHHAKRSKASATGFRTSATQGQTSENGAAGPQHEKFPNDGIDYDLLAKDRSACTPAELDKIRRERNRMHAKRTRDRKRMFMEEMDELIKQLEEENKILHNYFDSCSKAPVIVNSSSQVDCVNNMPDVSSQLIGSTTPSSSIQSKVRSEISPEISTSEENADKSEIVSTTEQDIPHNHKITVDQIRSLWAAATAYDAQRCNTIQKNLSSTASAVSVSTNPSRNGSICGDFDDNDNSLVSSESSPPRPKRQRIEPTAVPMSITTSAPTTVGC